MNKILFHICCGPCATASVKKLQSDNYEVTGFYYNPNIFPVGEYQKRLKEAKRYADMADMQMIIPNHSPQEYQAAIKGYETNQKERCRRCWGLRLKKTAELAKELGFENFGTSLRISPYQDQTELLALALEIAKKNKLTFYDVEMRPFYRDSVTISKELGMYRQKYCGCRFSRNQV